jgi:hypothetical protein
MANDTIKASDEDSRAVTVGDGFEVVYFANKHGISMEQAWALIEEIGNDRASLDTAAEKLKA